MRDDNYKKILFRFYSDILEEETVELLWAEIVDENLNLYKIDNIPFYIPFIATDDIVFAEYDDTEEALTFREMVKPSGNSTIWVVLLQDDVDVKKIRDELRSMGCDSESFHGRYFTLEVKRNTNYLKIKDHLNILKSEGKIDYAEPNLSVVHQY